MSSRPELVLRSPTAYPIHPQALVLFLELRILDPARPSLFHMLSVGIQTQWGTKGDVKEGLELTPMGSFDVGH